MTPELNDGPVTEPSTPSLVQRIEKQFSPKPRYLKKPKAVVATEGSSVRFDSVRVESDKPKAPDMDLVFDNTAAEYVEQPNSLPPRGEMTLAERQRRADAERLKEWDKQIESHGALLKAEAALRDNPANTQRSLSLTQDGFQHPSSETDVASQAVSSDAPSREIPVASETQSMNVTHEEMDRADDSEPPTRRPGELPHPLERQAS